MTNFKPWIAAGLLLALLPAGCSRNEIKVYRVAKEPAPPQPAPTSASASMPETMPTLPAGHPEVDPSSSPSAPLTWTLPAGWEQEPAGEMRVASFRIKGTGGKQADVSIVPLGGKAGG